MAITAAEQYGIELLNRARLDPAAEAHRYGISLAKGIPDGKINAVQKQVLASNDQLNTSSQRHSNWMLDSDNFGHTGAGGSQPDGRMTGAGFRFTGNWSWGENLAYAGLSGSKGVAWAVSFHHSQLMHSSGHRENIMRDSFREVGYSQETGGFRGGHGSMVTENFASRGTHVFVTGVAYTDKNDNEFYSIGEGVGGVRFTQVGHRADVTSSAGGYAVRVDSGSKVEIRITAGLSISKVIVDTKDHFRADPKNADINVKLDLVDGDTVVASSNLTLVSGASDARLLGINPFKLTGSGDDNSLTGNRGHNLIMGMAGDDMLSGRAGRDNLLGNSGDDRIYGGAGNDKLQGGTGDDRLAGGTGADRFVFGPDGGSDHVTDFKGSAGDRIVLDHDLWDVSLSSSRVVSEFAHMVSGDVVLDFGQGQTLTFDGLGSSAKLAAYIDII